MFKEQNINITLTIFHVLLNRMTRLDSLLENSKKTGRPKAIDNNVEMKSFPKVSFDSWCKKRKAQESNSWISNFWDFNFAEECWKSYPSKSANPFYGIALPIIRNLIPIRFSAVWFKEQKNSDCSIKSFIILYIFLLF